MSITLKRPMFRRGGPANEGIMSGIVDRTKHANDPFVTGMGQTVSKLTPEFERLLSQYTPKTRLPIGQFGLNIASGMSFTDALKDPYASFTKADDARRAAVKSGALKLAIAQASKKPETTNEEKQLLAAGFIKGTPEYKEAMKSIIFKDARTTAEKNADALNLTGKEKEDYIKRVTLKAEQDSRTIAEKNADALGLKGKEREVYIKGATLKTESAAFGLQGAGQVVGKASRDKIVQNQSFVKTVRTNLDDVYDLLDKDQSLGGAPGLVRNIANKLGTAAEGFGVDVKAFMPEGLENKVFDTDIARLAALEALIAPAYARVIFPNQRMTNFLVQEAQDKMNLTGLSGTEEVLSRLGEIKNQFDKYIENNEILLGNQPIYRDEIKKFKAVVGEDGKVKLVEIVE